MGSRSRTESTAGARLAGTAERISQRTLGRAARFRERLPRPVRRLLDEAKSQDLFLLSAGLAFYALVSIAPLVVLVMWIVSLVLGDTRVRELASQIGRYAPKGIGADQAIRRVATLGTSVGAWAIVTALWPATAYGAGLRRAFDRLSRKPQEQLKGLRGRGLVLFVIMPLFVLGSLIGAYAGTKVVGESSAARIAGLAVALGIGFVGAAAAILLIYRIFPPSPMPWREIRQGSIVAASGISLISVGFVAFVSSGTNFQDHYITSGLAGVVLLGVWLFLANALLLAGYKVAQLT